MASASRVVAFRNYCANPLEFLAFKLRTLRLHRSCLWVCVGTIVLALAAIELRSSWLQSRILTAISHRMTFSVLPGPSESIRYTRSGPYDERLGYSRIPEFIERTESQGYEITAQARPSKIYVALSDLGVFPIYHEKNEAGLEILDRDGKSLYEFRNPEQSYGTYSEIPPVVVQTLLYIENRAMLDPRYPRRNPAIQWQRLSRAIFDYGVHTIDRSHPVTGGSTLATQLEKMRHSTKGRTRSAGEKARQMFSASLRAYQDGPHTLAAQQRVIRDYLNSLPLAAVPGHGEVIGLGEGLETWYDTGFRTTNALLCKSQDGLDDVEMREQARKYREVLSLLLATRAPNRYLVRRSDALAAQTDRYLRLLSKERVISAHLRDRALQERPVPQPRHRNVAVDFVDRKARGLVRTPLISLLGLRSTYSLDRLDLSVRSTVDGAAQQNVTQFLRRLTDPSEHLTANLRQHRLLAQSDPRAVIYGFTLYERSPGLNLLRVQTDNFNQPLNINEGTKLELGSTAKLRTLVNYLQIVEQLHEQYAHVPAKELGSLTPSPEDRLTNWAISYLSTARDKSLKPMLEAALERQYSASPAEGFFTAGGLHHFRNFESRDDHRSVTVREAFERSVNLAFIRLMRDIERYYMCRNGGASADALLNTNSRQRHQYLVRFADEEGRVFLRRFYGKYAGATAAQALDELARRLDWSPVRLAVVYRSIRPEASVAEFTTFLRAHLRVPVQSNQQFAALYEQYGADKFNLADRGYLARVHPLELWLVWYLTEHPKATLAEVVSASANERQQSYAWLFRTHHKKAQDLRIRILMEEDAFKEIWREWTRVGYPFARLVSSYATAIGVSGDTPAALAELLGIIVNGGMRYPHTAIDQLRFAENTPMETVLRRQPGKGQRVLSADIAALVRQELIQVVASGTARRACCGFVMSDRSIVPLGGKTGTGDNRIKSFASGGRLVDSRVANRTAVFAFIIGDRFFGTVIVLVPGDAARNYEFTSSLPVQIFKDLEPTLRPLLEH